MRWHCLTYENGMTHTVSDDLLAAVRDDMAHAAPPGVPRDAKIVDWTISLETGGMCVMGRPYEHFSFCDLAICVPSEDLAICLPRWRVASAVTSLGQVFHRITSWPWKCLVVDSRQHRDLLTLLGDRVDLADRRAASFYPELTELTTVHHAIVRKIP